MKRFPLAAILFFGAAFWAAGQPRYLIQTGHAGPVTALEYHASLKALVSAGGDGTVKVWEAGPFTAVHFKRVAPREIALLALHPLKPRYAAVFEREGKYRLSVWDWSENRPLYSLDFDCKPLYVDFSPRGAFLAVCVENWKSLFLYEGEKGDPVNFQAAGSGIVSFATFSSKETTIMTYQPSGKISYWELGTAKKIREIKTQAGLVPVALSSNKLQLVCSNRDQIVFLDAVSGKATATADIPGLILSRSDRGGTALASFFRAAGGRESVRAFVIGDKSVRETFAAVIADNTPVTALAVIGETVFVGNRNGEVYKIQRAGAEKIVKIALFGATDLAVSGDRLVLAGADRLFVFQSDFFGPNAGKLAAPSAVAFASFAHHFAGNRVGLAFHEKNGLYLWKMNGTPGELDLLDPQTFQVKRQAAAFSSALLKLSVADSYYLSIEQSGLCRVSGLAETAPTLEYQSAGLNAAAFLPPGRIVLGKSSLSSYESALAVVAGRTGEITFLPEAAKVIYDLAYDAKDKNLYYVGIEKINDVPATVVKSRPEELQKNATTVFSKPGRFLNSSLACDRERGWLYFSLEDGFPYVWDGTAVQAFEDSEQPVRKIVPGGGIVYTLNDDSSVTAWDAASRRLTFRLFVFDNGSWLLVTRDGRYCSGGGPVGQYVRIEEPGAAAAELFERYRLDVNVVSYVKDSP